MDAVYPFSGFAVGALIGLTGMGGGALMTPMLILLFGVEPAAAVGTDLLFAAATKAAGVQVYSYRGNVDWRVAGLLAAGSVPGALGTVLILALLPPHSAALGHIISMAVAAALLIAAAGLMSGPHGDRLVVKIAGRISPRVRPGLTAFVGLLLGVLVSLTSVGAGTIGLVVLRQLYPELPAVRLVGSDIAHAVPLTLLAGGAHWLIGDVQLVLLASLLLGSIPGIFLASRCAHHIPDKLLKRMLGAVLLVVSARLLIF